MSDIYQVFDESRSRSTELYAALDLGSNSFHLVVARVVAEAVQIVSKVKHKVRLADGLDENNMLSQEAISRGVSVLESMYESMQGIDPAAIRVVATHTLRKAQNVREFLQQARKVFPYKIEVISGNEEARLIFVGIGSNSSFTGDRLIFDIGGGSTEFAVGKGTEPSITKSVQMGCVSYQRRFFQNGEVSAEKVRSAVTAAKVDLELAAGNIIRHNWLNVTASSGTARAVITLINSRQGRGLDAHVSYQELLDLLSECIDIGHCEAFEFETLTEDRRAVFVPGLCILIAIFQSLKLKSMEFSESALREGVLYELQPNHSAQSVRVRTAQSLATRYDIDTQYAHKVLTTSMLVFDEVKNQWDLKSLNLRHLLGWAALLHEVGLQIHSRGIQKHSSYILANSDMPGFNQEQQYLISQLVRFHRKRIKVEDIPSDINITKLEFCRLLAILRLSVLLNINRQASALPSFRVQADGHKLQLGFGQEWFELSPLLVADISLENNHLSTINIKLEIM